MDAKSCNHKAWLRKREELSFKHWTEFEHLALQSHYYATNSNVGQPWLCLLLVCCTDSCFIRMRKGTRNSWQLLIAIKPFINDNVPCTCSMITVFISVSSQSKCDVSVHYWILDRHLVCFLEAYFSMFLRTSEAFLRVKDTCFKMSRTLLNLSMNG